ncbi:hypothetical protein MRB53_040136 [Persea americana]|nr:hypothetical protein MRB53_040136 [Persea americana]
MRQRGKNSGDVAGKQYFETSTPGGGIFIPFDKTEKRLSSSSATSSRKLSSLQPSSVTSSPSAPSTIATGRKTPARGTGLVRPSFSQSVGPASLQARVASPALQGPKLRRESQPRPSSPVRQPRPISPLRKNVPPPSQTPAAGRLTTPKTRPSVGLAKSTIGAPSNTPVVRGTGLRAPSTANGSATKFSQSLRQSTTRTPSRMKVPAPQPAAALLGPDSRFDEEDTILEQNEPETTPTPAARNTGKADDNVQKYEQETQRLKKELSSRDQQLAEQANAISEMERTLAELQTMLPDDGEKSFQEDESTLPRDVQSLRLALREKNERIKSMSEEFDTHRADFRSTIDTLEMASTETERVYEQRVEDLLQQLQQLQDRDTDMASVAEQFKQLEELVQELEEGLEESRRAEAEARSEVEFLRGEVERSKSELIRERERQATQAALEGDGRGGVDVDAYEEMQEKLRTKENEIRGLKTIIQGLQNNDDDPEPNTPRAHSYSHRHSKTKSTNTLSGPDSDAVLQKQFQDLESLLASKSTDEELRDKVRELRKSVNFSKWSGLPNGHHRTHSEAEKHISSGSQSTIVGQNQSRPASSRLNSGSRSQHKRQDSTIPELAGRRPASPLKDEHYDQNYEERHRKSYEPDHQRRQAPSAPQSVSESSTAAQYCEICEENGHDILNCANMIGNSTQRLPSPPIESNTGRAVAKEGLRRSNGSGHLSGSFTDRPAPLRRSMAEPAYPPPNAPLPLPPAPRTSSLSVDDKRPGSNRSSATPATSAATSSNNATPTKPTLVEGTGDQAGMLGGKASGMIDPDAWCALCERDGHPSVDCPLEDAF